VLVLVVHEDPTADHHGQPARRAWLVQPGGQCDREDVHVDDGGLAGSSRGDDPAGPCPLVQQFVQQPFLPSERRLTVV